MIATVARWEDVYDALASGEVADIDGPFVGSRVLALDRFDSWGAAFAFSWEKEWFSVDISFAEHTDVDTWKERQTSGPRGTGSPPWHEGRQNTIFFGIFQMYFRDPETAETGLTGTAGFCGPSVAFVRATGEVSREVPVISQVGAFILLVPGSHAQITALSPDRHALGGPWPRRRH